jgi:hypothetical protein
VTELSGLRIMMNIWHTTSTGKLDQKALTVCSEQSTTCLLGPNNREIDCMPIISSTLSPHWNTHLSITMCTCIKTIFPYRCLHRPEMAIIYCEIGHNRTRLSYGGCPNDMIDKTKPTVCAGRRVPCPRCPPGQGANSIIHGMSLGDWDTWREEQEERRHRGGCVVQ